MIKVCHIVNLITGNTDGVYTHLKSIFRNYNRNKFEHILIFQGGEKIEREVRELGVKVFVSSSLKNKISLRSFSDIYGILESYNIDIIHTHLIKPYTIGGFLNIFLRKKFIFNYHGIFVKNNPYYNFFERSIYSAFHFLIYLFGKVDAVLVPSKRSKQLLIEETNLFPEPIVYYNGYCKFSTTQINSDVEEIIKNYKRQRILIAMVARLEVQKRIDRALVLFQELIYENDNINLIIFGDGEQKNNLLEQSKKLGIDSKVIFMDYVNNMIVCYKYFDMLLFTSDWEGMPLTMWEAMANEIPIVAPDVGGFREILEENNCGLVYEPGDMKEAEDNILKLLGDEQLRKKLGKNGKSAVEMKYTEKNFINKMEQDYLNILSK